MMQCFSLSQGRCKTLVEAMVAICGKDLNITIGGGERYHIGAVAIAVPRNEYKAGKKRSASTSVICVQGHREDELAYKVAKYLGTSLDCSVCVTIGIHIDDISDSEFKEVLENVDILMREVVSRIQENAIA